MTFEEVVDQALAMLQRRGRATYRMLQRHFQLDDAALEDLKEELLYGQRVAEEEERVLVWRGATAAAPLASVRVPAPEARQARASLSYTPPHLADKIRTTRATLAGERKHVTVLFADLKDSTELIRGLDPEAAQQTTCIWTTRRSGRRPIWRHAWSSSPPRGPSASARRPCAWWRAWSRSPR